MPDCSSGAESGLKASNFHMLPYSNRIRDGKFTFANQQYQLSDGDTHSIHGALRKLPWRVIEQSTNHASATYDTRIDGEVNWPWPIEAVVSYSLDDNQLISQMSLTNHGSSTMPAGMGWHPYFCRTIAGSEPQLKLAVKGVYPDTDGDCLPTGAAEPLSPAIDFSQNRKIDPNQPIDHCFSGFQSPATITWPAAGIRLQMHASANCSHLILFNPQQPYFAVEPVTNANDAFNLAGLPGQSGIDAGVRELKPGQTLEAQMRLVLDCR